MTSHKEPDRRQLTGSPKKAVLKVTAWALAGGLVAFFILDWAFHGSGLELLKVVLTMIAGFGGTVYLVVRYRTQVLTESDDWRKEQEAIYKAQEASYKAKEARRDQEQFIENKLFRAIEMLGAEAVSTKVAGVYALVDVSNTYGDQYKQRVVDILCGYLRSPRSEAENVVESTITEIIQIKLRHSEEGTWSRFGDDDPCWNDCDFNFNSATFRTPFRLSSGWLDGYMDFVRCMFLEPFEITAFTALGVNLSEARFNNGVILSHLGKSQILADSMEVYGGEVLIESAGIWWNDSRPIRFYNNTYDYSPPIEMEGYELVPGPFKWNLDEEQEDPYKVPRPLS